MFLSTELISDQSEQFEKMYHLRSHLDSTISFTTPMFLSTELISAQSEQISKMVISDFTKIQRVASQHPCYLVQN